MDGSFPTGSSVAVAPRQSVPSMLQQWQRCLPTRFCRKCAPWLAIVLNTNPANRQPSKPSFFNAYSCDVLQLVANLVRQSANPRAMESLRPLSPQAPHGQATAETPRSRPMSSIQTGFLALARVNMLHERHSNASTYQQHTQCMQPALMPRPLRNAVATTH